MNDADFKLTFESCLVERGFNKSRNSYYKLSEDIICVIGLQKTSFDDTYYINIGYVIRRVHPDVMLPRYVDGDIRARFSYRDDGRTIDNFDPHAFHSEHNLVNVIAENVKELVDGCDSVSGLKDMLTHRPTLLCQTTVQAKRALGIE